MGGAVQVDALTGAALGRYRLGGRLQVLPYATIHRGYVIEDGRPVLVWTFQEPYATAAGFLEALQQLAGDGRAAQVPGLLKVLEIGIQDQRSPLVYLVTEDAAGGFLVSLLQAGRAPGVFATTGRLARTVDQMHALGMVHGDIQPATVAISTEGPVLVGHSIRRVVSRVTPEAAWVDITRSFRPPEAPTSSEPVLRGDLWGLAALVYYLLVGRPPMAGAPAEPPSRLRPQLPATVDRAVLRALSLDPSQRFASGMEFFAAMRGLPSPARPLPPAQAAATVSGQLGTAAEPPSAGTPDGAAPAFAQASSPWPTEPALTPASLRAQSLPYRSEGDSASPLNPSESTQLIAMEPYRFEPKFRRRGGYLVLWLLVAAVVAVVGLLVTGRIGL